MPIIPIQALDDPRINPYRDLPRHRLPKESGLFIAESGLLVERLLASDYEVDSLFVEADRAAEYAALVSESTPVFAAERALFREVIGFKFHRCVLACGRRPAQSDLQSGLSGLPQRATVVVCQAVQDPENLGGLLRNCAAFGVDAVVLGPRCADPFSRRVLRVSMGTVFKLNLVESTDLVADLSALKIEHHFQVFGTVLHPEAITLELVPRPERAALLFGNEGHGLDEVATALCEHRVTIPMRMGTDSLNVAVASGIFLYHFTQPSPVQFD